MTGPNDAGNHTDVPGVFTRVRRDRGIADTLYQLLGYEDERDPEHALDTAARRAAQILDVCGPEYRVRVVRALQLMTGLVLDAAERAAVAFDTLTPEQQEAAIRLANLLRCQNVAHSGFGARLCDDCESDGRRIAVPDLGKPRTTFIGSPEDDASLAGRPTAAARRAEPVSPLPTVCDTCGTTDNNHHAPACASAD